MTWTTFYLEGIFYKLSHVVDVNWLPKSRKLNISSESCFRLKKDVKNYSEKDVKFLSEKDVKKQTRNSPQKAWWFWKLSKISIYFCWKVPVHQICLMNIGIVLNSKIFLLESFNSPKFKPFFYFNLISKITFSDFLFRFKNYKKNFSSQDFGEIFYHKNFKTCFDNKNYKNIIKSFKKRFFVSKISPLDDTSNLIPIKTEKKHQNWIKLDFMLNRSTREIMRKN